jgi:hypothetical protein
MARIIPAPAKVFITNTSDDPVPVVIEGATSPGSGAVIVERGDSINNDAFGRSRISLPQLRLSTIFDTGKRPLFWGETTVGTGLAVHLPDEYCIRMQVSLNADEVIRQTKEYFVYRAGQSQLIFATFRMDTPETNLEQEVGYYDANNGIFLQTKDTAINIVKRSDTSGAPLDTVIPQSQWNIDTLDGTGPSELTLDITKSHILVIDFQWLGVGRVRVGFDIDGVVVPVHQFLHANVITETYMRNPKLPVRYRIAATGVLTGTRHMKQICATLIREGGDEEPSVQREVDSGTTSATVGTAWQTVLGVRLASADARRTIRIVGADYMNLDANDPVQFGVILNPGGTGGATWASVAQSESIAEYSRSVISITVDGSGDPSTGVVLPIGAYAGGAAGNRGSVSSTAQPEETISLASDIPGTTVDEAWIIARVSTGTAPVRGILKFAEIR